MSIWRRLTGRGSGRTVTHDKKIEVLVHIHERKQRYGNTSKRSFGTVDEAKAFCRQFYDVPYFKEARVCYVDFASCGRERERCDEWYVWQAHEGLEFTYDSERRLVGVQSATSAAIALRSAEYSHSYTILAIDLWAGGSAIGSSVEILRNGKWRRGRLRTRTASGAPPHYYVGSEHGTRMIRVRPFDKLRLADKGPRR